MFPSTNSAQGTARRKRDGAYYTPEAVAAMLVRHAVRSPGDLLLDPSCGDGRFLARHRNSVGVERNAETAAAARQRAPRARIVNEDFFAWAAALEPVLTVCNPGEHPDDWEWWQELTRGRAIDLQRWRRFEEAVEGLFSQIESGNSQPSSPLLEALGVIVPRHAPSAREAAASAGGHTHLILFSDLLQHSVALSHYGVYPAGDAVPKTPGLRALQTDLTGVDVSLYRLERSRDAQWQTRDHYYWWTHLVHSLKGRVVWQHSV